MLDRNDTIKWEFNLKKAIKASIKNIVILILILTPLLSYVMVTYVIQLNSPIEKNPYVHWNGLIPQSQIYISWETAESKESYILYGPDPNNLANSVQNSSNVLMHRTMISGLSSNTKYYYRAGSSPSDLSEIQSFTTAPSIFEDVPFNFTLISDTQQMWGTGFYDKIASSIENFEDQAFVAWAGDMGQEPDEIETWNFFMHQTEKFSHNTPLVPSLGNHDTDGSDALIYKYFNYSGWENDGTGKPYKGYYSFNYSKTQFVIAHLADGGDIDPKVPYNQKHFQWLNDTLQAGQTQNYRILIFHRELFSSEGFGQSNIAYYLPVIKKYNVSLVFYGHKHIYERYYVDGHTFIQLGSGGGMQNAFAVEMPSQEIIATGPNFTKIYINGTQIILKTFSTSYDIIDEVVFEKDGSKIVPKEVNP
jgi:hypothetical protein